MEEKMLEVNFYDEEDEEECLEIRKNAEFWKMDKQIAATMIKAVFRWGMSRLKVNNNNNTHRKITQQGINKHQPDTIKRTAKICNE